MPFDRLDEEHFCNLSVIMCNEMRVKSPPRPFIRTLSKEVAEYYDLRDWLTPKSSAVPTNHSSRYPRRLLRQVFRLESQISRRNARD